LPSRIFLSLGGGDGLDSTRVPQAIGGRGPRWPQEKQKFPKGKKLGIIRALRQFAADVEKSTSK
jgi:hypothetical protein